MTDNQATLRGPDGKRTRCSCGCNVFHLETDLTGLNLRENETVYACNACGELWAVIKKARP